MKVLVFTSTYPNNIWPNHGVFVKERISYFARTCGCRVRVVAPVPFFPPIKLGHRWLFSQVVRKEIIEGIEVHHPRYFMTPKVGMAVYGLMMFLSVLPLIKKIYGEFDFDVISAHTVYPDGFAGVLLGSLLGKPVIVSARGTDINLFPKFPIIRQLIKYTLMKADKVISVCQALKEEMTNLGIPENKISVIPNGVDLNKFYPVAKEEAREKLGLPRNNAIILSVGSLIPRKGFDMLIKALKILNEEYHQEGIYMVIAGEGGMQRELENLVSTLNLGRSVLFAGPVPHKELYLWYSAADLFCLASSREGWPNVILESLACGTPVVATEVWGIPEIIRSEKIGFLTQRNERAIAVDILNGLKKQWDRKEIINYSRENTWDKVAISILNVFKSALNEKNKV